MGIVFVFNLGNYFPVKYAWIALNFLCLLFVYENKISRYRLQKVSMRDVYLLNKVITLCFASFL